MTASERPQGRIQRLTSQLLDGDASPDELSELNELVQSDPNGPALVVDHLLLDSLLRDELGSESLTALVDLVVPDGAGGQPASDARAVKTMGLSAPIGSRPRARRYRRYASWLLAAAAVVLLGVIVAGRWESPAFADAAEVVQAAIHTHAEPVERVYVVEESPRGRRDVRITAQGDRFWVEMIGARRWAWGRAANGTIWLALGPHQGLRIEADEAGPALRDGRGDLPADLRDLRPSDRADR